MFILNLKLFLNDLMRLLQLSTYHLWLSFFFFFFIADVQVQDFLLHSQNDVGNASQGMWLQQACALFIQSGVQLLTEFTQHAAAWANTSVVRANFSQPNHTRSQLERWGHNHGSGKKYSFSNPLICLTTVPRGFKAVLLSVYIVIWHGIKYICLCISTDWHFLIYVWYLYHSKHSSWMYLQMPFLCSLPQTTCMIGLETILTSQMLVAALLTFMLIFDLPLLHHQMRHGPSRQEAAVGSSQAQVKPRQRPCFGAAGCRWPWSTRWPSGVSGRNSSSLPTPRTCLSPSQMEMPSRCPWCTRLQRSALVRDISQSVSYAHWHNCTNAVCLNLLRRNQLRQGPITETYQDNPIHCFKLATRSLLNQTTVQSTQEYSSGLDSRWLTHPYIE